MRRHTPFAYTEVNWTTKRHPVNSEYDGKIQNDVTFFYTAKAMT